ncbi:MFS transporter [Kineococcus sp. TBRC 1896]|uniref:MFS transporter n=1 Tax=Kineococcus mangrovi TaxID=1660183 RepID=A0ABV4I3L7_9ACTN
MSHPDPVVGYRALLALPGVPLVLTAATLARLSYATFVLSLLLAVQSATGSYAAAGTALGVYGLTASTMPAKARLLDTVGARRVLPLLSTLFALALTGLAVAAGGGVTAVPVHVAGAAVAGVVAPPVGPTVRAVWARLTPDPGSRQRAYGLDAVVESGLFALGPVLAAALAQTAGPALALAGTAVVHLLGGLLMAVSPLLARPGSASPAAPPPSRRPCSPLRRVLGPLARPGYAVLLVFTFATGLGNDPLEVAVVARGQQAGATAPGLLLAVLSVSAAAGGLAWGHLVGTARGRRLRRASPWSVLAVLAAVTSVAAAAAALAPGVAWLVVALVVVGAAGAPLAVVVYTAADRLSGLDGGAEATTWVNTATNLGASLGTAGAGALVDAHGTASAFWAGAAVTAAAAVGAWSRRWCAHPTATGAADGGRAPGRGRRGRPAGRRGRRSRSRRRR